MLSKINAPVIKVIHVSADKTHDYDQQIQAIQRQIDEWSASPRVLAIILDSMVSATQQAGGTGMTFDWSGVDKLHSSIPILLAGGIQESNLSSALQLSLIDGVDASSSIELAVGKKDTHLMDSFFEELHR